MPRVFPRVQILSESKRLNFRSKHTPVIYNVTTAQSAYYVSG